MMKKRLVINYIVQVVITAFVLSLTNIIFAGIYIDGIGYAILASVLLIFFNATLKPFLKFLMLPLNILTLGIFTPLVDVIILKLIGVFLGSHFMVDGWLSVFFAAIFISIVTFILDKFIGGMYESNNV